MSKGIPIWEQHVEKIVLGIVVLVFLAAVFLLAMESPNVVQVGSQQLAPAEVNAVILSKANDVGSRMRSGAGSPDAAKFAEIKAASADGFLDRLGRGVSPAGALPRIAPALASSLLPEEVGSVDVYYYEPAIAAPSMRGNVVQTRDTLEKTEIQRVPELASRFDVGTLDLAWTTPVAEIDLEGLRQELASYDELASPPRVQIPSNWYRDRAYMLDIVFERQELMPDGRWSSASMVPVVPGARTIREEISGSIEVDANFRDDVFMNLDDPLIQQELLQPDFYATVNSRFTPPTFDPMEIEDDDSASTDGEVVDEVEADRKRRVRELQRRLRDRTISATRTRDILEELGGELDENDPGQGGGEEKGRGRGRGGSGRGGSGPPGGGGPGGPGGPGGGFGGKKGSSSSQSESQKRQRIGLTKKLRKYESEIERIQGELGELAPNSVTNNSTAGDAVRMLDTRVDERLLTWTHDLDVTSGATYRYRVTLKVFNPLFARGRQLLKDQRHLSEQFAIASVKSDWSEPVVIDPPVQFFFVRASEDGGTLGLGEARIELYRYHDGRQRTARFTLQPGERIGESAVLGGVDVDFTTDWYLVDVIEDPAATGRQGLDHDQDAIVVCRRMDGSEIRVRVPSSQLRNPDRVRLEMDAQEPGTRG